MLYRYMVFKTLKCKNSFCDVITSVLYPLALQPSPTLPCLVSFFLPIVRGHVLFGTGLKNKRKVVSSSHADANVLHQYLDG